MIRSYFLRLTTTVFFFFITANIVAQFSYQPRRTNILVTYSEDIGWKISDITGQNVFTTLISKNAFIQVLGTELKVYEMAVGLWNTQSDPEFLDRIHTSFTTYNIPFDANRFDYFSSFWISADGGHIRFFKKPQIVKNTSVKNQPDQWANKNLGNHIFINGNRKTKISSKTSIYMIAPQGNIFEIDHTKNIWRFILTNRTLTPWSSDPPTEKMVFQIFRKEDFKSVIPIGNKNNKFWFQIVDHDNKMGLATLTMDYFQITYEIPPLFDFISPSLANNYHLVFNDEKLGVLYFLPNDNDDEIAQFETIYTPAKKSLSAMGTQKKPGLLLADNNEFSIQKNGRISKSSDFKSTNFFSIEIGDANKILYNEYSQKENINNSGLYNFAQRLWFIPPHKSLLTSYPNANLETQINTNLYANTYSAFSKNGMSIVEDVSNMNSRKFFKLISQITDLEVDSMMVIPDFTVPTFKFRASEKWGVLQVHDSKITVLVKPNYLRIDQFGTKESLALTNENSFDWFGINYSEMDKGYQIKRNNQPLILDPQNSLLETSNSNSSKASILNGNFIYSSNSKAFVFKSPEETPVISGTNLTVINDFIWSENKTKSKNLLYSSNLKIVKTPNFDSAFAENNLVILLRFQASEKFEAPEGENLSPFTVVSAFYSGKTIKALSKLNDVYYYNSFFVGKNDNNQWQVVDPSGIQAIKESFGTLIDACGLVNSLK